MWNLKSSMTATVQAMAGALFSRLVAAFHGASRSRCIQRLPPRVTLSSEALILEKVMENEVDIFFFFSSFVSFIPSFVYSL
jgi:hypothetical protein